MTTPALKLAETYRQQSRGECLRWGAIELQVTDLPRAIDFWTTVLGLVERRHLPSGAVELGTSVKSLIVLHPGAAKPVQKGYAGMYHVAIGMPTQTEFSTMLQRLIAFRVPISPVDHTMSKAVYLFDPDGHGIEIAYETPERFSRFVDHGGGFGIVDADGHLRSGRDPLDLKDELSFALGFDPEQRVSNGVFIAHLHLHVPALEPAIGFFEKVGFTRNLILPRMGMADLGAGGGYTHRIAVNIWNGPRIAPAPQASARLLAYHLIASETDLLEAVRAQFGLEDRGGPVSVHDTSGVRLCLGTHDTGTMHGTYG